MSGIATPNVFAVLAWIAIVSITTVDLAPSRKSEYGALQAGYEQPISDELSRPQRNLGNSDITKLLDDLDNQTEAMKNGQEIGDELLTGKNQTKSEKEKLDRTNNSSNSGCSQNKTDTPDKEVTDSASQAVQITDAPVLVDTNGIPNKTTAIENGASYLTGKPLLVLNRENKDPDVNTWFLYYPLSTESDKQIP